MPQNPAPFSLYLSYQSHRVYLKRYSLIPMGAYEATIWSASVIVSHRNGGRNDIPISSLRRSVQVRGRRLEARLHGLPHLQEATGRQTDSKDSAKKGVKRPREQIMDASAARLVTWAAGAVKDIGTNSIERVPERSKVNEFKYIIEEWEKQGIKVKEEGDHILRLIKDGQTIAIFKQTGVKIDNLLKEVETEWELITSLPDGKALILLSFLVGYLWKEDKLYEGIAAWIENENRAKENERGNR